MTTDGLEKFITHKFEENEDGTACHVCGMPKPATVHTEPVSRYPIPLVVAIILLALGDVLAVVAFIQINNEKNARLEENARLCFLFETSKSGLPFEQAIRCPAVKTAPKAPISPVATTKPPGSGITIKPPVSSLSVASRGQQTVPRNQQPSTPSNISGHPHPIPSNQPTPSATPKPPPHVLPSPIFSRIFDKVCKLVKVCVHFGG